MDRRPHQYTMTPDNPGSPLEAEKLSGPRIVGMSHTGTIE